MKSILVAVDLAAGTETIVEEAAQVAQRFDGRIRVIHVVPHQPTADEYRHREAALQRIGDSLWKRHIVAKALLVQGPTIETILEEAVCWNADMVVLGVKKGRDSSDRVLGRVSEGVVRGAPCPVLVVPAGPGSA